MKKLNIKETQASIQKKEKKIKVISLIVFATFLSIWFLSWIIFAFNKELGAKLLMISSLIITIPILIGVTIETIIRPLHKLLKNKKIISKITGTLVIINITLFLLGVVILFLGVPFDDKYLIEKVKVLDIRENKILIDDSINNHGDTKIIKINKPFYANIKEGDTISVRYPNNKREKMYYVIDFEIGENLLGISSILCIIIMSTHTAISIISSMKSKNVQ